MDGDLVSAGWGKGCEGGSGGDSGGAPVWPLLRWGRGELGRVHSTRAKPLSSGTGIASEWLAAGPSLWALSTALSGWVTWARF